MTALTLILLAWLIGAVIFAALWIASVEISRRRKRRRRMGYIHDRMSQLDYRGRPKL